MDTRRASRWAIVLGLGLLGAGCGSGADGGATTTGSTSGASGGAGGTATTTGGGGAGGTPTTTGADGGTSAGGAGGGSTSTGGGTTTTGTGGAGGAEPTPVVHAVAGVWVSTLAGSATAGPDDGVGAAARFHNPVGVALDGDGRLVVAEFDGDRLRRIDGDVVTTLTTAEGFSRPFGLAIAPDGALYVETDAAPSGSHDDGDGTIWRVDPETGAPTLVVAKVGWPRGLAALPDGRLVMADRLAHTLRLLDPDTGATTLLAGAAGTPGFADGHGAAARFADPYGLAIDPAGDVIVADRGNHRLRKVTLAGDVTTLAGAGGPGMVDGPALAAHFRWPQDVAVDAAGNVYVSDRGNQRIRRLDTSGEVATLAGDGVAGFADGDGTTARFFGQEGLEVTADGRTVFVADGDGGDPGPYHRVRKIEVP